MQTFHQKYHKFNLTKILMYSQSKVTKYIMWLLPLVTFSIPLSTLVTNVLMITFTVLWLLEGNYINKANMVLNNNYLPVFIIIFSLILGSTYSIAPLKDIMHYLNKMHKLIYLLFLAPYFQDANLRKTCINSFITAGLITVFIGLYLNKYNPFKNSIDTSLVVSLSAFFLMHKLIHQIEVNPKKKFCFFNLINIFFITISVFYLFFIACNRTSQIIFPLLTIAFIIQKFNTLKKHFIFSLIIILLVISSICSLFLNKNFDFFWVKLIDQYKNFNFAKPEFVSFNQRRVYYFNSLNLIKENPIFGTGTGSFPLAYKKFIIKHKLFNLDNQEALFTKNPHNEYLLFGSQFGIYGILLLLFWFGKLFKTSLKIDPNLEEKYILQGLVINMFIGCSLNSWLLDFTAGHLFIIFTAICLGALANENIIRLNRTIVIPSH